MALVQDAKVDLVSALNREAATALADTGLQFSQVQPGAGDLAKIRLTAKADYDFRSTRVVQYHRRNLADLLGKFRVYPRMQPQATLYALLTSIRDAGVRFTTDDLEDALVVTRQDGMFEVQLTAKPGSIGWYGTGTFIFQNLPPISLAYKEFNLTWS